MSDPRYPLGAPINRPPERTLRPIPGRPNWHIDLKTGKEVYMEPQKPMPPWPFPIAKHLLTP